MSTTESTPNTELATLVGQLEAMRKQVEIQHRQTLRSARLTAIVGAALLLLSSGYFLYAYNRIAETTQPEVIVAAAETMVDDNLPRVRLAIEKETRSRRRSGPRG